MPVAGIRKYRKDKALCVSFFAIILLVIAPAGSRASTYVVFIPMDSPIYQELETLDGLGVLHTYISELKPVSRLEAARLTIEADNHLAAAPGFDRLANSLVRSLREQLHEEIDWLEHDGQDSLPTMLHPLERVEAQYVFSSGVRREMNNNGAQIKAQEATPLLPNNDDLPTAGGSNEVLRVSSWAGAAGFLTAYGEGTVAGPLSHNAEGLNGSSLSRARLIRGEIVASFGNTAISWGMQEMSWGVGHYASLSQGSNARPFPALRVQNLVPSYLPSFMRYLGPFRAQAFFGQLDHNRVFSRPWISGQLFAFKPLPTFEFGLSHVIMFGGRSNDQYGLGGFLGRATGLDTGSASTGNTNSRAGVFLRLYFPSFRNLEVYQEILGEDNLTTEVPPVGRFLPFLAVSYQGGVYLPRLTADGLTDARFEYAILEPNYSTHGDSLYWTYYDRLMAHPLGPNASEADLGIGRWIDYRSKIHLVLYYTERAAPRVGPTGLAKEHSGGAAVDFSQIPLPMAQVANSLVSLHMRLAVEYVGNINFQPGSGSFRIAIRLSAGLVPSLSSWKWQ
jgi:hypothetical protein